MRENYEKKMAAQTPGGEVRMSCPQDFKRPFFLADFFRVRHDRLSERTTHSLLRMSYTKENEANEKCIHLSLSHY